MNEDNKNFDNGFSNTIVVMVGTVVRTLERSIVVFWDGLKNTTVHGTPSLLGFVAAILPLVTPAPVAGMTAYSLMAFLHWEAWQAVSMAIAIEGIGFVVYVSLTEELIRAGWKGTVMQFFFAGSAFIYQVLLIAVNSILAAQAGEAGTFVIILALLSLLPALSSIAYGYRNQFNKAQLDAERSEAVQRAERERQEAKERAEREYKDRLAIEERIRQERREDSMKRQELKLKYAADTEGPGKVRKFRGKQQPGGMAKL